MKRNRFGINVDEGIALTTAEEFDRLFVDMESDALTRLEIWLQSGEQPVLVGGQIGCGKTTLIEYAFSKSAIKPDITFHFDSGSLNISAIDSWSIIFVELFRYAAIGKLIHIDEIPSTFKNILGDSPKQWQENLDMIRLQNFSESAMVKNEAFNAILLAMQDNLGSFFDSLLNKFTSIKTSPLVLFASGVDKFQPGTTAYYALTEILPALCAYKTLFEVNAVHLFYGDFWMHDLEKIFISAADNKQIEKMLAKRLGKYAATYDKEIPLLAKYAGGIPRQALRLLDSFLAVQKRAISYGDAIFKAVESVNRDFFAFSRQPEQSLMQLVNKDSFLDIGLISLPGDKETAQTAVFGNWIILKKHITESQWQVCINPLIKQSFVEIGQEDPEQALLREYARQTGISGHGLEIDILQADWQNSLKAGLESPLELNVTEILDLITGALLSKQRADRIIIAFEEQDVAEAVRRYLEAKSNSYEYQVWDHHVIRGDALPSPLIEMLRYFSEHSLDVYSFEFTADFSKNSLEEFNIRRDSFIDKQLIWWIPKAKLSSYLGCWTQLRQLFQVYILEEDLTKSLNIGEIESDLDFMNELADTKGTAAFSYVDNLKVVLNYLKECTRG